MLVLHVQIENVYRADFQLDRNFPSGNLWNHLMVNLLKYENNYFKMIFTHLPLRPLTFSAAGKSFLSPRLVVLAQPPGLGGLERLNQD